MPLVARRTSEPSNGSEPSAELLPSDGVSDRARPPAPARALAAEALRLRRRLATGAPLPAAWSSDSFLCEVALVRAHLSAARTRAVLAASYGQEAFHTALQRDDVPGPVRVAYAMRWLELDPSVAGEPWISLTVRLTRRARSAPSDEAAFA